MKVLLIEDNDDHKLLIEDYLDELYPSDLSLVWQKELSSGLEKVQAEPFDLMFCDLNLPDSNITQTVEKIRELKTDVPIVVLTSLDDESVVKSLIHKGVQDYIAKEDLSARLLNRVCVSSIERKHYERQLQKALKEKDVMLSEIYHRVKNNLQIINSMLSLQLDHAQQAEAIGVLQECRNRVNSMALIHQSLYQSDTFEYVPQREVIEAIVQHLLQSYSVDYERFRFNIQVDEISLPINISIPLGLIVNELCLNVIKHVLPYQTCNMGVNLQALERGGFMLTVTDNGPGLPEGFDLASNGLMGLTLVGCFIDQLDGDLSIKNQNPTSFSVEFDGVLAEC